MGGSLGGSNSSSSSSSSQDVMSQQIPYLQQLWGMATGNVGQNDYINQIGNSAFKSSTLPVEAQEYLHRVMIQISGQFADLSRNVEDLKARIAVLEMS